MMLSEVAEFEKCGWFNQYQNSDLNNARKSFNEKCQVQHKLSMCKQCPYWAELGGKDEKQFSYVPCHTLYRRIMW